jgi:hypothetical protein
LAAGGGSLGSEFSETRIIYNFNLSVRNFMIYNPVLELV